MSVAYYTHDNGGRPFKVVIDDKKVVKIYKQIRNNDDDDTYEDTPSFTYEAENCFIGVEGNSILLEMEDGEYIFIGTKIFIFEAYAPITEFVSPIGNPYAIDKDNNYYLLIEDVVLEDPQFSHFDNVYDYYHDYKTKKGKKKSIKSVKALQNMRLIEKRQPFYMV